MAVRMRKSINLGGGVRMNVGKKSVGLSAGTRGARYSVSSSGRRTRTIGVPGTGVSHVTTTTSGKGKRAKPKAPPVVASPPAKPGMLAPKHEKEFFKGVEALLGGNPQGALDNFEEASRRDTKGQALSDDLLAGLTAVQVGDAARAIPHLEAVVASEAELPDELLLKYAPGAAIELSITSEVSATVPVGSMAAALALVECYQDVGRQEEAIGLLQRLIEVDEGPTLKLSLCELYMDAGEWDEIVELGAGVANEDDLTLQIRLYQAAALAERGQDEVALEVYREALRSKRRSADLLKEARYGRGRAYLRLGKKAQGRKDLAAVYTDDPGYRDVAQLLKDGP
jgi:tetratricopeptide (TPR) repeat protein